MRVNILTDELQNAATSPMGDPLYFSPKAFFFSFSLFFVSNQPLHARISNNLNKELIMMTKFTIHEQRYRSFVFKDSQLSFLRSVQ